MAKTDSDARDLVLITGASGFVGSAIANAARQAGYRVRVFVRPSSPRTNISAADDVAVGDICDQASVAMALRGVRYVFHAAADYRLWSPAPDDIVRTNVEGTRHVMEEAIQAKVERIVYTSSVATLELRHGLPADEGHSLPAERAIGAYKKSKILAERLVLDMVELRMLPAVIVNPSTPIGPRDVKPTPTGRVVVECASGRMPGYVDTGLNLVHVDDVAAGHLAALRHGKIGERYILGGENVRFGAMLAAIANRAGRRPPQLRLPIAPLFPIAVCAEWWGHLTGKEPFVTRVGLRMSRHYMYFDDTKARRDLGYTSRPYGEAVADAVTWFTQAGYLRR
jgi:dihydroflavonol-4-reductase